MKFKIWLFEWVELKNGDKYGFKKEIETIHPPLVLDKRTIKIGANDFAINIVYYDYDECVFVSWQSFHNWRLRDLAKYDDWEQVSLTRASQPEGEPVATEGE